MRILNGRTRGESLGRPTFHGRSETSVIDYITCNQNVLPNAQHLVVNSPTYLSDHSHVVAWINLYNSIENTNALPTESKAKLQKLPLQYVWTNDSQNIFVQELETNETQ